MHKNKHYVQGTCLFITSRVEQDLPFITCKLINTAIWGILARASTLWDISICHFLFMSNHFHLIAVVRNPSQVPMFIKQIKQETAAAINRITGRRQHTIWCKGFDDPIVLTADKVRERIKYIYKNPAESHLVGSINHYPGVSSWEMYKNKETQRKSLWLKRSCFERINNLHLISSTQQSKIITKLAGDDPEYLTFTLSPDAWMDCFPEYETVDREQENWRLIQEILSEEKKIGHPRGVVGVDKLKTMPINKEFKSRKFGKRMYCISSDIGLRKKYINYLKSATRKAKEAYKAIKNGICNIIFPPGMFMPGGYFLDPLPPDLFLAT